MFKIKDSLSSPSPVVSLQGTDTTVTYGDQGVSLKRIAGGSYDNGFLSLPISPTTGLDIQFHARKSGVGSAFAFFGLVDAAGGVRYDSGPQFSFGQNEISITNNGAGVLDLGPATFEKWYRFGFKFAEGEVILSFQDNPVVTLNISDAPVCLSLGASYYEQLSICYKNLRIKST